MAEYRPFELQTRPGSVSGSTVISASGPLVMENIFRFQELWRADQSEIIIFDLAGVIYMDSSAVGSLVNAHVHLAKNGRNMALAAVPDRAKQVLIVTKVDMLFQFYPSVAEAETALIAMRARA
jgi:anti-sigma B factor antagonist